MDAEELVDIGRYPLHRPGSVAHSALLTRVGEALGQDGCAVVRGFVRAGCIPLLVAQCDAAAPNAQAAYAASKGGLVMLTRELAAQWAKHRIRVNSIAPGYFETELTEAMFVGEDAGLRYIRRNTLLGRAGDLDELDGPLLLLASDAGTYITGQTLAVDGGWTAR